MITGILISNLADLLSDSHVNPVPPQCIEHLNDMVFTHLRISKSLYLKNCGVAVVHNTSACVNEKRCVVALLLCCATVQFV